MGDYSYYGETENEDNDGWEDIGTDYSDDGPDKQGVRVAKCLLWALFSIHSF